jgi:hypothetical protein
MTTFTPARLFSFLLIFSIVSFSACKVKNEEAPVIAHLRFINASPTLGTYNIYVGDRKVNTMAIPFGGTVSFSQFSVGNQVVKYTTASAIESVLTKQVTLVQDKVYSLYLIDKGDKMDALLVSDDASATSTTKAFVKFINLSPDAPALSLDVVDGANLFTGKTYKTGTDFVQVDPKAYNFNIKDTATGAVKTTLNEVTLVAGRYYTIISRGMLTPGTNDQPFSAQSIISL